MTCDLNHVACGLWHVACGTCKGLAEGGLTVFELGFRFVLNAMKVQRFVPFGNW